MKKPAKPGRRKARPAATTRAAPAGARAQTAGAKKVARRPCPIVGIGASAGGLEALELFLRNVPDRSGLAFVVIQHLDPTRKGVMPELLQRATAMPVVQVEDRTTVEPDCVYVIPPNKDLSLLHGVLYLIDPVAPRGLRLPIDFFFRSLADDAEERSIGVVLSGMGSDGTLGIRAIKGKAGAVFVQDPASAKFDGMPRSAIDAGLADVVAPAEELPGRISAYLLHVPLLAGPAVAREDKGHSGFEKVAILLRARTGHDFSLYKKTTVYRRIERRMGVHQIARIDGYVRLLQENPAELDLLFKELLIGVTSFFRDPAAWEYLGAVVLPELLSDRPAGEALRVWIPGCATGEEAYSMAIAFFEAMEQWKPARGHPLQIFATDLDHDAIDRARAGVYPANIEADVSPERLGRFFVKTDRGYQIAKAVREVVIFAPQSVIMDPPFTRLDLVSCRNLLIYLTPELQKKLVSLFHYSLNPGGVLLLGTAESIGGATSLFEPLANTVGLYRRLEPGPLAKPLEFPTRFSAAKVRPPPRAPKSAEAVQTLAEHLLLQQFSPPAVLVNDKGDILFISGRTGKYLEPAAGKANWNIYAMAREGLRLGLSDGFRSALRRPGSVIRRSVTVGVEGGTQAVDLTVQAIQEPAALRGLVMVVFVDVATPPDAHPPHGGKARTAGGSRAATLQRELDATIEQLQIAREEMRTSQEEARSAHEELQSTNEELQSTNEELTTSKEEMQSMNEELQTLNAELLHKVEDLTRVSSDVKNLLESVQLATVFLDSALRVRLFTTGSKRIFRLIPGDVGRPITDIAAQLDYPTLADDAREVLRTLVTHQQEVATGAGGWFLLHISPYRTLENVIDGVVITFTDITASKTLEARLRETQARLERHIVVQDAKLVHAREALKTEQTRGKAE